MTKKPDMIDKTSTKGKPASDAARSAGEELADNDLHEVTGGLAKHEPATSVDPVCVSKLS